jgi:membrane protease YdiL (CAAX protease family)
VRQGRSPFAFVLSGVPLLAAAWLIGLPATGDAAVSTPVATAFGVLTGAVLFRGFAGVWPDLGGLRRERGGIIALRSTYLTVRSALEELAWRGFVLGVLARTVTAVPALLLSSIGFALAHASIVGRQKLVHVATGAAFGSVYLLTGRLASAISAPSTTCSSGLRWRLTGMPLDLQRAASRAPDSAPPPIRPTAFDTAQRTA